MKYPCDLIGDLLPLWTDGICSEESQKAVQEHLAECESCRKLANLGEKQLAVAMGSKKQTSVGERMFRHIKSLYFILGTIGYFMLGGWIIFLLIALLNPQMGVFGSLYITYILYSVYIVCMCGLIVMSCILRPKNIKSDGKIKAHAWCLAAAWICFALWWLSFFIHNLFGWNSPSLILRHLDTATLLFVIGWLLLLLIGGILYGFDCKKTKK